MMYVQIKLSLKSLNQLCYLLKSAKRIRTLVSEDGHSPPNYSLMVHGEAYDFVHVTCTKKDNSHKTTCFYYREITLFCLYRS